MATSYEERSAEQLGSYRLHRAVGRSIVASVLVVLVVRTRGDDVAKLLIGFAVELLPLHLGCLLVAEVQAFHGLVVAGECIRDLEQAWGYQCRLWLAEGGAVDSIFVTPSLAT